MLTNAAFLQDLIIHATDGELGTVEEVYFDDESWGLRYFIVKTGNWLSGRKVLISPISILSVDWKANSLHVSLTKEQVENSPKIDTHQPVSRRHEAEFLSYYAYNNYWVGPYLWGPVYYPADLMMTRGAAAKATTEESADSHLRSSAAVTGYHVEAKDGEIGHVCGYVIDDTYWNVRYIEVATRNWLPGKKVLISPAWIERVSWLNSKIYAGLFREAIKGAPEYTLSEPITREYENRLYFHYGQPPYWADEASYLLTSV